MKIIKGHIVAISNNQMYSAELQVATGEITHLKDNNMLDDFDVCDLCFEAITTDGDTLKIKLIETGRDDYLVDPTDIYKLWETYSNNETLPMYYKIEERNGEREHHMHFAGRKPTIADIHAWLLTRAMTHFGTDELPSNIEGVDGCEVDFGDCRTVFADGYEVSKVEYEVLYKHLHNEGEALR